MIDFSPRELNNFLEFFVGGVYMYREHLEYSDDILKELSGGCSSWGIDSRILASLLTAKYNVLFRIGIFNWFPTAYKSRFLKKRVVILYAIVFRNKYNLGKFLFPNIVNETENTNTCTHLGYQVLIHSFCCNKEYQV